MNFTVMTTESCVKIETLADSRSEIYYSTIAPDILLAGFENFEICCFSSLSDWFSLSGWAPVS